MSQELSQAFQRKLLKLDQTGLEEFLRDRTAKSFAAEMKFNRTRGVKDGQAYRLRRLEVSAVKSRLYAMVNRLGEFAQKGDDQ